MDFKKGKPKDDQTGAAGTTSETGTTGEEAQGESQAPEKRKGSTGLPNAGAADDSEKLQKRMRRAAGLSEKK